MRILTLRPGPSFSVQDVSNGWVSGLRQLGIQVADLNLDDRLDFYASSHIRNADGEFVKAFQTNDAVRMAAKGISNACFEFWPDAVVIVSGFFIPNETVDLIRSRGIKVVYLFTESPYEDDRQILQAAHGDLVILNDPTNLEKFRRVNPKTYYIPHAYDPARHYPGDGDPEMVCDFAFVGTGFPSRVEFFDQVDFDGLDVIFGGGWQGLKADSRIHKFISHPLEHCLGNDETAELYRSARTSLNFYRKEFSQSREFDIDAILGINTSDDPTAIAHGDGWACGPREIELAACETFFLRDPRPESDELFPMLPTFSEPDEIRPLLDYWLTHPEERGRAAMAARNAIADRTFRNHAAWLARQLSD